MNWIEENNILAQTFVFKDFSEALSFVNKVGDIAESQNHHPDICIQNYKEVLIKTTTHDAGNTITKKDYELAKAIDTVIQKG